MEAMKSQFPLLEFQDGAGCSGGCVDGSDEAPVMLRFNHGLVDVEGGRLADGVILQVADHIWKGKKTDHFKMIAATITTILADYLAGSFPAARSGSTTGPIPIELRQRRLGSSGPAPPIVSPVNFQSNRQQQQQQQQHQQQQQQQQLQHTVCKVSWASGNRSGAAISRCLISQVSMP